MIISLTDILNHNLITCAQDEIKDLAVCIAFNGEKVTP